MTDLVFIDTETTGLEPDADIWEFAGLRYELMPDNSLSPVDFLHMFIEHDAAKAAALPERFYVDLKKRFDSNACVSREDAAGLLADFLARRDGARPHVVGAVPNFDTELIAILMYEWEHVPQWHHHLIDVEALALGWLASRGIKVPIPWQSDDLSRAIGVDPGEGRHTALHDARWARDIFQRVFPPTTWDQSPHTMILSGGQRLTNVHDVDDCEGRYCPIHNPSEHALTSAPLWWRSDIGIMERMCGHGVGHPDPDDLAYRQSIDPRADGTHGCDGCCG